MADLSDEPMDVKDVPLPSRNDVLIEAQDATASTSATPIAARKTKAQKQREYRQRLAASRTPEEEMAARKLQAERQRNNRLLHKATALVSASLKSTGVDYLLDGLLRRTAYNHTMADQSDEPMDVKDVPLPSRNDVLIEAQDASASTSATPIAARKTKAQKQREYRQRLAASRTPEEEMAARKLHAERQRNNRLLHKAAALVSASLKSTGVDCLNVTDLPLPSSSNFAMSFAEPQKTKAQKQREYRLRLAASRTPEQVLAARKENAARQRRSRLLRRRLRKDAKLALIRDSMESTISSSSRSPARSKDVQTITSEEPEMPVFKISQNSIPKESVEPAPHLPPTSVSDTLYESKKIARLLNPTVELVDILPKTNFYNSFISADGKDNAGMKRMASEGISQVSTRKKSVEPALTSMSDTLYRSKKIARSLEATVELENIFSKTNFSNTFILADKDNGDQVLVLRKKKRCRGNWTEETLQLALAEIKEGNVIRVVGRKYGIPESTLRTRMRSGNVSVPKMGRRPIFNQEQEKPRNSYTDPGEVIS